MKTSPHILNIDAVELQPRSAAMQATGAAAERFDARIAQVGTRIGAVQLGYNITCVPPGKRAFPLHNHRVNEEMFFILEGAGTLRMGKEEFAVRQGDFIACPAGGAEVAHQLINTGTVDLKYLAVSTKHMPEVAEYPDSAKFAVLTASMRFIGKADESKDYWEGE